MKHLIKISLIICFLLTIMVSSCKKNNKDDAEITSSEDLSQGENNYDQVFKEVDGAATDASLKKGGYPIKTLDTMSTIKIMSIDYGKENYLCKDGNYRRGVINVSWTGKYREMGTSINISFIDFYQNDNHIEGTKSVTNNGRNLKDQLNFTIVVNGKITAINGQSHTWNSNKLRVWVAGESTTTWNDDVYEISGTTTGTNRNGISYTAVTTKPIRVDLSCQFRFVSGIVELTPEGRSVRTIDFGNGACDNQVTITVNGKSHVITKRR